MTTTRFPVATRAQVRATAIKLVRRHRRELVIVVVLFGALCLGVYLYFRFWAPPLYVEGEPEAAASGEPLEQRHRHDGHRDDGQASGPGRHLGRVGRSD